ncbi:bifunctional folylpolyglutamate synthase/dihydrofolate synthase [bacterium]|nr:bifunctional folylpolyglutamate synthase/dihydrofolate synthase [bacterium]
MKIDSVPDYPAAVEALYGLQRFGIKLGLEKINSLLEALGRPEKNFPAAHVAGTNGKGACAAAIHAVLRAHGLNAGLYTSPHLCDLRERVRDSLGAVPESFVRDWVEANLERVLRERITFFETVTALAFDWFARREVVAAAVEVGLGGRWDATNALTPAVSVITSIGREHEAWLGRGLARIAGEKAGIAKPGVPLLCGVTARVPRAVIEESCRASGSPFLPLESEIRLGAVSVGPSGTRFNYRSVSLSLERVVVPLYGAHQARNLALGLRAAEMLLERLGVAPRAEAATAALAGLVWPGRFQRVSLPDGGELVLDVAHNPDAARKLATVWRRVYGARRAIVVAGLAADKDYASFLAALAPLAARFVLTVPDFGGSDNRSGAAEPQAMARALERRGIGVAFQVAEDVPRALESALDHPEPVLVTGSFRTVGEAMRALGLRLE